MEYITGMIA